VGTFVLAAGLQHPALLARDCATVDLLSDGRLEIGLGAGVSEADFQRVGVPYGTPGERVERLSATVQALKHALEAASAAGSPAAYPAPAQRPYPPLLIAGNGRRVLSLAAREAVIVAVSTGRDFSEAALAERIAWLGEAASERFHQLELSINLAGLAVNGVVPPQVRQRMQMFMQADADAVARSNSPFLPSGSIADVGDQIQGLRERLGISYIQVSEDLMDAFAPVVARLTAH
jgi:probable F420-dependent oxidoreductase